MTGLVVPPFFKSLDPPLYLYIRSLNFTTERHAPSGCYDVTTMATCVISYTVRIAQFPYMRSHI